MRPLVVPFVLYLVLTQAASLWPAHYPILYTATVAIVGFATWILLRGTGLLQPHRHVTAGIGVGILGIALWIGLCRLNLDKHLQAWLPSGLQPNRIGYNPLEAIEDPMTRWAFILVRIAGMALLVPVAEELFWRGFLLRWLISAHWEKVPLGRFTWPSFAGVTFLFMLAHPEWISAAVYCMLLNGLLYWKRDLWSCVVAHGISNLALAIYILASSDWSLW